MHRSRTSLVKRQIIVGALLVFISYIKGLSAGIFIAANDETILEEENCTKPAISEFPGDIFTQSQRIQGGFLFHFAVAVYLIFALELVCDEYFVPSLEVICDVLNIKPDVAGATFMAAGTSSPEFFTNVIGTFITETDLGIGTIVGTAVFNIFGVIAACGIFAGQVVSLDWYPITRDCFVYALTIVVLIVVLIDEQVQWYESLVMVLADIAYNVLMYYNESIEKWSISFKEKIFKKQTVTVSTIELNVSGTDPEETSSATFSNEEKQEKPWTIPKDENLWQKIKWGIYLPMSLLLYTTIPRQRCLLSVTFIMCMIWIGIITYVVAWMITLIGYTFGIPDSVIGLTFLAIGTSVPEVFSSLIVSRKGEGSMAISNSIGSNTFDILICLGLPWLIKSIMTGVNDDKWFIQVNSDGLAYTVVSLLASLFILYLILSFGKFKITKTIGWISLGVYLIFLTFSTLIEMNVFFEVNQPTCVVDV